MTSASRPASAAHVAVITGGRQGVEDAIEHAAQRTAAALEPTATEIPPEKLAALAAVLERADRIEIGGDAPDVGHEAEWLTEGLGRGEGRIGALGVVLTLGKGVSVLAEADPEVDAAVKDALRVAAATYAEYVANHAMTRIGPAGAQEHVAIDPDSLRATGWVHGHSAAGDPHRHAHLLVGSTIRVGDDPRPRAIHMKHFLEEVAQQAEAAARVAVIEHLAARGINLDPLALDLAGIDEEALKQLNRFSVMSSVVAEAEAHGLSHRAAWTAARRSMKTNDGQPLAPDLRPLVEQVRMWAKQTWRLPTPEGEIELRLSEIEQLEHALDGMSRTPEGRQVVLTWHDLRSAGAWQDVVAELHRVRAQAQAQELPPAALVLDYASRLGRATEAGQVITRAALRSHAQAISAVHGIDFEQVDDLLQTAFLEIPGRRGLVAVAELEQTVALAAQALDRLTPVESVDDALRAPAGVSVIQGVAGAGKTAAVFRAAREEWSHEQNHIWVLSRNAKTAHDLGEAVRAALGEVGADSDRVVALPLADPKWASQVAAGDRIVVDEFALAERDHLAALLDLGRTCPVTLLGDVHQQRAIETPTSAQVLGHVAAEAGQPNLTDTVRCEAWHELHDAIRASATDSEARERAVAGLEIRSVGSAAEAARVAQSVGALLLTSTNGLAAEAAAGMGRPAEGPTVAVRHGVEVGVGSPVTFRAIVRDDQKHVRGRTGDLATVVGVEDQHVVLRHEDGRQVTIPLDIAREALADARVQTIDAAQGRTVERAAVLVTGGEDSHALYSAATRGREAPLILVLQDQLNEDTRARDITVTNPRDIVRDVLGRSDRGHFLDLDPEQHAALLDELRQSGHVELADQIENLAGRLAAVRQEREQQQQQGVESEVEREQEPEVEIEQVEVEREPEPVQQQQEVEPEVEREQEPEVERVEQQQDQQQQEPEDPAARRRREAEERYQRRIAAMRQEQERGWGISR